MDVKIQGSLDYDFYQGFPQLLWLEMTIFSKKASRKIEKRL